MGIAAHPLTLKYGVNKLWNINLLLNDYNLYILKGIYVKLYIENFLWFIIRCRYQRFISILRLHTKGSKSDVNYFFNRYFFLNNYRWDLKSNRKWHLKNKVNILDQKHYRISKKKILPWKHYFDLKKNFISWKIFYKDFVFNWDYLKYLQFKRCNNVEKLFLFEYKKWKSNLLINQKKINLNKDINKKNFHLLNLNKVSKLIENKKFFFYWRRFYLKNFFFNKKNFNNNLFLKKKVKIKLFYLFKLKKKLYKILQWLWYMNKSGVKKQNYIKFANQFYLTVKKKNKKNLKLNKKKYSFYLYKKKKIWFWKDRFTLQTWFLNFKKNQKKKYWLAKNKNNFKYGTYLHLIKDQYKSYATKSSFFDKSFFVMPGLYFRRIQKNKNFFYGFYKLESFSLTYTNGMYYIFFNTSATQKLHFLKNCLSHELKQKQQQNRDFFYLIHQLLNDKLERMLKIFLKFPIKLCWRDTSNTLLYNWSSLWRESFFRYNLDPQKYNWPLKSSFRLPIKWRSGYMRLLNTIHNALYWGSSLLLANVFYEKLTNVRFSLPIIFLLFKIISALFRTIVSRKNIIIKISGVFKKGAKKRVLNFNKFGFKTYKSINVPCDYSFITCSTRTGSLGIKIFIL